jgi:hypothetical protein
VVKVFALAAMLLPPAPQNRSAARIRFTRLSVVADPDVNDLPWCPDGTARRLLSSSDSIRSPGEDETRLHAAQREPVRQLCSIRFFVTSFHLVDWLERAGAIPLRRKRQRLRREDREERKPRTLPEALHAICRYLADGAKHFSADDSHRGVAAHVILPADPLGLSAVNLTGMPRPTEQLVVRLEPNEAVLLQHQLCKVDRRNARSIVLNHWSVQIASATDQSATSKRE